MLKRIILSTYRRIKLFKYFIVVVLFLFTRFKKEEQKAFFLMRSVISSAVQESVWRDKHLTFCYEMRVNSSQLVDDLEGP